MSAFRRKKAYDRIVTRFSPEGRLFQVDEHVGAAIAGLEPDARVLIDQARVYAQSNRLMYDETSTLRSPRSA